MSRPTACLHVQLYADRVRIAAWLAGLHVQGSKPMYMWVPLQTPGKRGFKARVKRTLLRRRKQAAYDPAAPLLKVRAIPAAPVTGQHCLVHQTAGSNVMLNNSLKRTLLRRQKQAAYDPQAPLLKVHSESGSSAS